MLAAKRAGDKATYHALLAQLRGTTVLTMDEKFARVADAPQGLGAEQVAVWRDLFGESGGALRLAWNPRTLTPASITGWKPPIGEATPLASWEAIQSQFPDVFSVLYGIDGTDELLLFEERHSRPDYEVDGESGWEHAKLTFHRRHAGFRVQGDTIAAHFLRAPGATGWALKSITSHWVADLPLPAATPAEDVATRAELATVDHFAAQDKDVTATADGEPLYLTRDVAPAFVLRVVATSDDGPYATYVDPSSFDAVHVVALFDDDTYAANVKAAIGLPYDENKDEGGSAGKRTRGSADATIYEDSTLASEGGEQWTEGDDTTDLGLSTTTGSYSIVYSGGDTDWVTDLRGLWAYDQSHRCWDTALVSSTTYPTAYCADDLTFAFTAGSGLAQSKTETGHKTRRAEAYAYIDHMARIMNHVSVGIPGYDGLSFLYTQRAGQTGAQSPSSTIANIIGGATASNFPGGTAGIKVYAPDDMDDIADIDAERRFRGVLYHEYGHTLRYKEAGSSCGDGSITNMKCLCRAFEEGRADFTKVAGTRLENVRPEYRPYFQYPPETTGFFDADDCRDANQYDRAAYFTRLYTQLSLRVGHTRALQLVYDHVGSPTTTTALVCWQAAGGAGACTGTTVPADSYYKYMIDSSRSLYAPAAEFAAEVSAVFHDFVTDADPSDGTANTTFPWYDDIPNLYAYGTLVPADDFAYQSAYSEGPVTGSWGSGDLSLSYGDDHDSFKFIGRVDETYRIETYGLGGNADTKLEILDLEGNVLHSNDDCNTTDCSWCRTGSDANHSCYDFTPSATKVYVARISSHDGEDTLGTYDIRFEMEDDDAGDAKAASNPVAAYGTRIALIDTNSDEDWYHLYATDDFTVNLCATSGGLTPTFTVYDASNNVILTKASTGACPQTTWTATISTPGYYWIKVASRLGASSGTYNLTVDNTGADQDIDSSAANAIPLTLAADQGIGLGLYFNSSGDEDWLKIDAEAGYVYDIVTEVPSGSSVDTVVEVYAPTKVGLYGTTTPSANENPTFFKTVLCDWEGDANCHADLGHWMLQDDDSALTDVGSNVTFTAPVKGTYYIRVTNKAENTGKYNLVVSRTHYAHATFLAYP